VDQPCAVVSGAPAWLLSRVLRSERVTKVLANPHTGVDRADLAAVVNAIHRAGRAHENRLDRQRRDNADPPGADVQHCWTTEQTATYLGLSLRRVQELAPELDGERVGRRWLIPAAAAHEYSERRDAA
jgi:excisionase family DNA binding protein